MYWTQIANVTNSAAILDTNFLFLLALVSKMVKAWVLDEVSDYNEKDV